MASGGLRSTSFKPGHKGLGGRPRIPQDVIDAARAYTEKALRTLGNIMEDTKAPASAKAMAAQALLDRGWGKAAQHVAVSGHLTLEQLVAQAAVLASAEAETPAIH